MSAIEQKEDWLLSRREGIGGTDAAAICGLSPWKRPIDVFVAKVEPLDVEPPSAAMWWGSFLESGVRRRYQEETGERVSHGKWLAPMFPDRALPFGANTIVRGAEAWQFATPDGVLKGARKGLEIKTSSSRGPEWGNVGSDEVPAHYLIQCVWLMAVTEIPLWDVAALFRGSNMEVFSLRRDSDLEQSVVERCRAFWHENVLKGIPPDVDESESYGKYLARKHSLGNDVMIAPTPEIDLWAAELHAAGLAIEEAEQSKRLAANKLMELLGDDLGALTQVGKVAWVRPKPRRTTDWEGVATQLKAPDDLIFAYTREKPSAPYVRGWFGKEGV